MSDKVKEIEMELKPYETMCEQTTECLRSLITGGEDADPNMILAIAKTLGEIVDVKKDIVEMCYKKQIIEAMEENADEYGETWDEEGPVRKYYPRMRDSRGRFMSRRGYEEMMPDYRGMERDMDMDMGRMYYSGSMSNRTMPDMGGMSRDRREGNSGMMRRNYMETKEMHRGNSPEEKQEKMRKLEEYIDELSKDVKEMIMDATVEERTMLKQKMAGLANTL